MKTQIVLLSLLIAGAGVQGQSLSPQTVNVSSGGDRRGQNFLDWSIGEMVLVNHMQSPGKEYQLSNGVLQPFAVAPLVTRNIPNAFTSDEIRLLPNPTPGLLKVDIRVKEKGRITIRLFDRNGNLLQSKSFMGIGVEQIESVNLSGLINGSYMLRVELQPESGEAPIKSTYNIIKIG